MKVYVLPIEMVNALRSWFHPKDRHLFLSDSQYIISRNVMWQTSAAMFGGLPGLVGFWPMSSVNRNNGNANDMSGQARVLSSNGNFTYNLYGDIVAYADFDGNGDFLSRADEVGMDVSGVEATNALTVRGLTMGGWFWGNDFASGTAMVLMGKLTNTAGTFAYWIVKTGANTVGARVSSNGTAITTVSSTANMSNNTWYFIVERFISATELAIFVNGVKTVNTTSIPSSINNSAEAFAIGGIGGTNPGAYFNGRASNCFLCANALSDATINRLFEVSKKLYGVE